MFREDFEFHDAAGPTHHGGHAPRAMPGATDPGTGAAPAAADAAGSMPGADAPLPDGIVWLSDAERELKKIPFFVRGKAGATPRPSPLTKGLNQISIDTLYEAKAHYAR